MPTSHKHHPINLEQVLNAFDHTLIVSEQLGWKHLKQEMLKIQRTHDQILTIFENNQLEIREKIDAIGELVLHSYQEELTYAKASDALDFAKKINNHNNNLHYARMLALILRDLSPKIDDEELNKLIKARQVERIREIPHDLFYDTSPIKETKTPSKKMLTKSTTPKITVPKSKLKASATKTPAKKLPAKTTATKIAASNKPASKTLKAKGKGTKPHLKS